MHLCINGIAFTVYSISGWNVFQWLWSWSMGGHWIQTPHESVLQEWSLRWVSITMSYKLKIVEQCKDRNIKYITWSRSSSSITNVDSEHFLSSFQSHCPSIMSEQNTFLSSLSISWNVLSLIVKGHSPRPCWKASFCLSKVILAALIMLLVVTIWKLD